MDIGKALVVDDSKVVQFKLKRMLEARGMAVDTAASGLEALNFLKDHAPHVIFMDCMMPDMDGYEATAAIKAAPATAAIPVIMCTGHDTPEEQQRARETGASDYMVKPFDDAVLDGVLARLRAHVAPAAVAAPPIAALAAAAAPTPAAHPAPASVPAPDLVAQSARIAERVAKEVAEQRMQETTATLLVALERSARDIAQEVAAGAVREAMQAAMTETQAARQADAASAESRLRDALADVAATAERVALQTMESNRWVIEKAARELLESVRADLTESARSTAQAAARTVAETTARAAAEQLVQDAIATTSKNETALVASVGQAAAGTAERVIREMLQPALDAAEAARASVQATSDARLQEALASVYASAERAMRETTGTARAELEQAAREILDTARAEAASMVAPAPVPSAALAPPDTTPAPQTSAWSSRRVLLPWLAGLSIAVLYLLLRSFF